MNTTKLLSLLILAGGLSLSVGCGDKPPPDDIGDGVVDYGNPKQNFRLGVDLLAAGKTSGKIDYEGAYTHFYNATMGDASFAKAHLNAGLCAERLGRLGEAEDHLRQALENAEGYTEALLALASVLSARGKDDEALGLYRDFVAANPTNLAVRASLTDALINAELYDDAILETRQILARNKDSIVAYTSLARVYHARGEYEMSLLCSQKALTLTDKDPAIYNATGVTHLELRNEPAAIDQFKTAIKLQPGHLDANMNLGWTALNSGDYVLAKRCFEAVIAQYPGNVDALLGLAVSQRGVKELDEASKTYDKILSLDPDNELVYFNAATLHEKYTKNYKKAMAYLQGFVDTHVGQIGPDHEVYERMERVRQSQAAEEAKEAERKRLEQERKEREQRQKEQLKILAERTAKLEATLDKYGSCPIMVEMGMAEMGLTVLEQAKMVVEANEFSMAADMMTFFDQVEPEIEALIPSCAPAPAPAPEPEPEEPAVEEPAVEEPAVEEPAVEEPAVEEPAVEEPAVEEPAVEEPAVEEPAAEEAPAEQE
jgi:tetratricopeptide (TPR) repeat protein